MNSFFMTDSSFNEFPAVLERLKKDNLTLPEKAFHEKAYQCLMQNYFLQQDGTGEHWYIAAEEHEKMLPDSPVGSMQLRVDYNKRPCGEEPIVKLDPVDIHTQVVMALWNQYSSEHYPRNAYIECIRITARVAPDVDIEHVYWPSMHHYGERVTAIIQGTIRGEEVGTGWYRDMFCYEITPAVVERLVIEACFGVYEEFHSMLTQEERDDEMVKLQPIMDGFVISDDKKTASYETADTKLYIEIINELQIQQLQHRDK